MPAQSFPKLDSQATKPFEKKLYGLEEYACGFVPQV
jgi:hypothetical protein